MHIIHDGLGAVILADNLAEELHPGLQVLLRAVLQTDGRNPGIFQRLDNLGSTDVSPLHRYVRFQRQHGLHIRLKITVRDGLRRGGLGIDLANQALLVGLQSRFVDPDNPVKRPVNCGDDGRGRNHGGSDALRRFFQRNCHASLIHHGDGPSRSTGLGTCRSFLLNLGAVRASAQTQQQSADGECGQQPRTECFLHVFLLCN